MLTGKTKPLIRTGKTKSLLLALLFFSFTVNPLLCFGSDDPEIPEYQLYKNYENFGIVVFPKDFSFAQLEEYVKSIDFDLVESGKAAMRFGTKGENATFMMPLKVQKKHGIKQFIVLQVLPNKEKLMVGIYDREWGLTLPDAKYSLEDAKKNIPKTLDVFRSKIKKREIFWRPLHPRGLETMIY